MPLSTGEKYALGVGGGLLLVGIAYMYITARETARKVAGVTGDITGAVSGAVGAVSQIPVQIGNNLVDAQGNIVGSVSGAVGQTFDAAGRVVQTGADWVSDVYGVWRYSLTGIPPVYSTPGDLDPAPSSLPPETTYTGPTYAHDLDTVIQTGNLGRPIQGLHDMILWTVGQYFRTGEPFTSADWSNINSYMNSTLPTQDPYLYQNLVFAVQSQGGTV